MTLSEAREALCYADQLALMFPDSRSCQQGRRIAWEMWWKAVRIAWGASQRQELASGQMRGQEITEVACRSLAEEA